jgi:hypothetical protein
MPDPQPQDFAGAQPRAITQAEQQPVAQRIGTRQQTFGLVLIKDQRDFLRLLQMINLRRQIVSAQGHTEQET